MPVTDISIDPVTRDLDFDGQELALVQGRRAVAQHHLTALGLHLGEAFMNRQAGFPWRDDVLVKNPDLRLIEATFRSYILTIPGTTGIRDFTIAFDGPNRNLTIDYLALTDEGEFPVSLGIDPMTPSMLVLLFEESWGFYG